MLNKRLETMATKPNRQLIRVGWIGEENLSSPNKDLYHHYINHDSMNKRIIPLIEDDFISNFKNMAFKWRRFPPSKTYIKICSEILDLMSHTNLRDKTACKKLMDYIEYHYIITAHSKEAIYYAMATVLTEWHVSRGVSLFKKAYVIFSSAHILNNMDEKAKLVSNYLH